MSTTNNIRDFAFKRYIEPARREGKRFVTNRAGDVHEKIGLFDWMTAVSSALGSKKFEN